MKRRTDKPNLYPFLMSKNGDPIIGNEINFVLISRMLFMVFLIVGYFTYVLFYLGEDPPETKPYSSEFEPVDSSLVLVQSSFVESSFDGGSFIQAASGGQSGVGRFDLPQRIIRPTKILPIPDVPAQQRYNIILYSYYPSASADFCLDYDYDNQDCLSAMTSGLDWREYNQGALACPDYWLGETVTLESDIINGSIPCLDTGTTAVCTRSTCTLFILDSSLRYRGDKITAYRG